MLCYVNFSFPPLIDNEQENKKRLSIYKLLTQYKKNQLFAILRDRYSEAGWDSVFQFGDGGLASTDYFILYGKK